MLQRLRKSQVDTIDLIDDIEPKAKAEVAQWRKRAEGYAIGANEHRVSGNTRVASGLHTPFVATPSEKTRISG